MMAHVSRPAFSLHLLIFEARERARRRRVVLATLLLVVALGATGGVLALRAASGRPASSPFGSIESSQGAGELALGALVRFHPNARFETGLELPNLSDRPVIVTDVRVLEPPHSFIHQTGTALLHWRVAQPDCSSNLGCMPTAGGFNPQPLTATAPPRPLEVKPGNGKWTLGVQFDFRVGSCGELTSPNRQSPADLVVFFHEPNGPPEHQAVRLGAYKFHLARGPVPPACRAAEGDLP
jgi:hypothetical protein